MVCQIPWVANIIQDNGQHKTCLTARTGAGWDKEGGCGAAPELIYHTHSTLLSSHFSPSATTLCWWRLEAKPCHTTCHKTSINVSLLPPKNTFYNNYCVNMQAGRHDCRSSRYFLSHVNICKGEVWKVWDSLLLSKKMCHLDAEGWKRVAGCEHLIWIISSSRLQFSLHGQMDWDFLCQCWISKSVLPGHSQPL